MYEPRPVPEGYQDIRTFLNDELADIAYWLRQLGSAAMDYGHIYGRGGKTTPAVASTYLALGNTSAVTWASGLLDGMTRTSDKLYSTNGGTYLFTINLTASYLYPGIQYRFGLSVNGAQPTSEQIAALDDFSRSTPTIDRQPVTLTGLVTLTAGQYVQIMATSEVTAQSLDHSWINITMRQVA